MPVDFWDGEKIVRLSKALVKRNMNKAMILLKKDVIVRISRTQPTFTLPDGRLFGLDPSLPGEPPKVVTGKLLKSIRHVVETTPTEIIGTVGVLREVFYAKHLEFGFSGTDQEGNNVNIKPRPFLRPALAENLRALNRKIFRGSGPILKKAKR